MLAEAVLAAPTTPLKDLPLLTAAEEKAVLALGRGPRIRYPAVSLPDLVAVQAKKTPDAVAVRYEGTSLSYRELDAKADALAHVLAERGIKAGNAVVVATDRSFDLVVATIAAHRAGAVIFYLDRDFPPARQRFLLADSRAKAVIVSRPAAALRALAGRRPLITVAARERRSNDTPAPLPFVLPDTSAYLVYTSGSTGDPKGVVLSHRNVMNSVYHRNRVFRAFPRRRVRS